MSGRIRYRYLLSANDPAVAWVGDFADDPFRELDDVLTRTDDLHLDHRSARDPMERWIAVDHLVQDAAK